MKVGGWGRGRKKEIESIRPCYHLRKPQNISVYKASESHRIVTQFSFSLSTPIFKRIKMKSTVSSRFTFKLLQNFIAVKLIQNLK